MEDYKMRRFFFTSLLLTLGLLLFGYSSPAHAQDTTPAVSVPPLAIFTDFPSQVVGVGENVTINLKLDTGTAAQIVHLDLQNLPDGWTADFRGGSHLIQSVYVQPGKESTVDLKLALPSAIEPGTYTFKVMAAGDRTEASLPIEMMVQQKLPPSLNLSVDLPTLRGKPDGTFRYNATLRNEGDDDLNVDLLADLPSGFTVSFKSGGQEVTTLPLDANSTKSLSIEVSPLFKMAAASYPITVHAQAGSAAADIGLVAEVVGQSSLNLTTPDGRLSGEVQSGQETAVNLVLQNSGSAAAEAISLSATTPNGWTVTFVPKDIPELAPGSQVAVTAQVQPADKALAGDYVLSFKAQPKESTIQSVDYRATVRTSTLWGIGGLVLIAVAVGVVGLAVSRFGRR
jgi:uncharacterized membrane protein